MSDRVSSAIQFLQDPTVASAPLPQRIDFLKSKGLSEVEIEQALGQAAPPQRALYPPVGGQTTAGAAADRSDWRDWLIIAAVGGGAAYALSQLARRYLFPALTPPDASELQQATAALEAKYDEAAQLLEQLKTDSESVKATVDRQNDKVDGAVDQLTSALEAFQTKEKERDEEFQKAKEEIDALRELLNQANERQSREQASSMSDIRNELKSLKALLGPQPTANNATTTNNTAAATASTPSRSATPEGSGQTVEPPKFGITSFSGKGGLPAWQLAGHHRLNQMNGLSSPSSTPSVATDAEEQKVSSEQDEPGSQAKQGGVDSSKNEQAESEVEA